MNSRPFLIFVLKKICVGRAMENGKIFGAWPKLMSERVWILFIILRSLCIDGLVFPKAQTIQKKILCKEFILGCIKELCP